MILTKTATLTLKGTSSDFKKKLADELNTSLNTFYRWVDENKDNGPLTTVKAVRMITEETGLDESQVLEEVNEGVSEEQK